MNLEGVGSCCCMSILEEEDGWIVAECPALPGCISQGKTEQEALENIKEAMLGWFWAEDQKALATLEEGKKSQSVMVAV